MNQRIELSQLEFMNYLKFVSVLRCFVGGCCVILEKKSKKSYKIKNDQSNH